MGEIEVLILQYSCGDVEPFVQLPRLNGTCVGCGSLWTQTPEELPVGIVNAPCWDCMRKDAQIFPAGGYRSVN